MALKEGKLFSAEGSKAILKEIFNQDDSNLQTLSLAELEIRGGRSTSLCHLREETLAFNLKGPVSIEVQGASYRLEHYDILYLPKGEEYIVRETEGAEALVYLYRALAQEVHPVQHRKWAELSTDPSRIRILNRKKVYLMFDVAEASDRFMAGYTFYEDHARAWPPHNHTDQEECYSFIEGSGAMHVYEDDEHLSFVKETKAGSHVTIPVLNYHPVFSHEEPLCFIWCIAGERYWVGDKNKDFMKGKGDKITT
ncbi:MAG TPA: 5-deoxy-glucuronate isomerase [Rectinemataceae bacterium]